MTDAQYRQHLLTEDGLLIKALLNEAPSLAPPRDQSETACIEIMSIYNKFAELDPTHFRCAICTLRLTFRGVSIYCELEVHYHEIMRIALNEDNLAYEHYNFFRRRLAGQVPEDELDQLLESKLVFLVDATGIPVLLSLLVLIFTSGGEDLTKLPSNRIELCELGRDSPLASHLSLLTPHPGLLPRHTDLHPPVATPGTSSASSRRSTRGCSAAARTRRRQSRRSSETGCGSSTSTAARRR